MEDLKNLSMADLLAVGKHAQENIDFAKELGDIDEENTYDSLRDTVYLEIEARLRKLFPNIEGL